MILVEVAQLVDVGGFEPGGDQHAADHAAELFTAGGALEDFDGADVMGAFDDAATCQVTSHQAFAAVVIGELGTLVCLADADDLIAEAVLQAAAAAVLEVAVGVVLIGDAPGEGDGVGFTAAVDVAADVGLPEDVP